LGGELRGAEAAGRISRYDLLLVLAGITGAPGAVGLDDAGGGVVGIGHNRAAYAKSHGDG